MKHNGEQEFVASVIDIIQNIIYSASITGHIVHVLGWKTRIPQKNGSYFDYTHRLPSHEGRCDIRRTDAKQLGNPCKKGSSNPLCQPTEPVLGVISY
jgi:hypothetical protein